MKNCHLIFAVFVCIIIGSDGQEKPTPGSPEDEATIEDVVEDVVKTVGSDLAFQHDLETIRKIGPLDKNKTTDQFDVNPDSSTPSTTLIGEDDHENVTAQPKQTVIGRNLAGIPSTGSGETGNVLLRPLLNSLINRLLRLELLKLLGGGQSSSLLDSGLLGGLLGGGLGDGLLRGLGSGLGGGLLGSLGGGIGGGLLGGLGSGLGSGLLIGLGSGVGGGLAGGLTDGLLGSLGGPLSGLLGGIISRQSPRQLSGLEDLQNVGNMTNNIQTDEFLQRNLINIVLRLELLNSILGNRQSTGSPELLNIVVFRLLNILLGGGLQGGLLGGLGGGLGGGLLEGLGSVPGGGLLRDLGGIVGRQSPRQLSGLEDLRNVGNLTDNRQANEFSQRSLINILFRLELLNSVLGNRQLSGSPVLLNVVFGLLNNLLGGGLQGGLLGGLGGGLGGGLLGGLGSVPGGGLLGGSGIGNFEGLESGIGGGLLGGLGGGLLGGLGGPLSGLLGGILSRQSPSQLSGLEDLQNIGTLPNIRQTNNVLQGNFLNILLRLELLNSILGDRRSTGSPELLNIVFRLLNDLLGGGLQGGLFGGLGGGLGGGLLGGLGGGLGGGLLGGLGSGQGGGLLGGLGTGLLGGLGGPLTGLLGGLSGRNSPRQFSGLEDRRDIENLNNELPVNNFLQSNFLNNPLRLGSLNSILGNRKSTGLSELLNAVFRLLNSLLGRGSKGGLLGGLGGGLGGGLLGGLGSGLGGGLLGGLGSVIGGGLLGGLGSGLGGGLLGGLGSGLGGGLLGGLGSGLGGGLLGGLGGGLLGGLSGRQFSDFAGDITPENLTSNIFLRNLQNIGAGNLLNNLPLGKLISDNLLQRILRLEILNILFGGGKSNDLLGGLLGGGKSNDLLGGLLGGGKSNDLLGGLLGGGKSNDLLGGLLGGILGGGLLGTNTNSLLTGLGGGSLLGGLGSTTGGLLGGIGGGLLGGLVSRQSLKGIPDLTDNINIGRLTNQFPTNKLPIIDDVKKVELVEGMLPRQLSLDEQTILNIILTELRPRIRDSYRTLQFRRGIDLIHGITSGWSNFQRSENVIITIDELGRTIIGVDIIFPRIEVTCRLSLLRGVLGSLLRQLLGPSVLLEDSFLQATFRNIKVFIIIDPSRTRLGLLDLIIKRINTQADITLVSNVPVGLPEWLRDLITPVLEDAVRGVVETDILIALRNTMETIKF